MEKNSSSEKLRKFQLNIVLLFTISILIVTALITTMMLEQSEDIISDKLMTLIEANSKQLTININSYLKDIEETSALLFADENYYLYDATDEKVEEYDRIQSETIILNRIVDLGLMENYSDFGIVYANDHSVGWVSNTTQNLFPDGGMYQAFSDCIINEKTEDGWVFGIRENYDRLYYTKRLNPNAVLVVSFHLNELNTVFDFPEELEGLTVYLVNEKNQILFATDEEKIAGYLPENVTELVGYENNITAKNADIIANSNVCRNNWRVVCSVSNDMILREINEVRGYAIILSIVVMGISVCFAMAFIKRVTKPVDGVFMDLNKKATIDTLSGVANKASFREMVQQELDKEGEHLLHVYVMLDMDNFKQINDTLGHDYGDRVIARMGKLLRETFRDQTMVGRIGGDEFSLYRSYSDANAEQLKARINLRLDYLMDMFAEEFEVEKEKCNISLSLGICVMPQEEATYDALYKNADSALYISKKSGKNRYTYYQAGGDADEKK